MTDPHRASAEGINATLVEIARKYNLPALAAGFDNGTFREAVIGLRKVGTNADATTEDIWHFGSNTKAMTATTIGMLIQDGLLRWDSSLRELLDGIGIEIGDAFTNVTVEQLSSHTSGISDKPLQSSRETLLRSYELGPSDGRILVSNFTLSVAPVTTQGTYEYSNMNYVLLGLIIDTVSGETVEDVIQSRLWNPLGISTGGWGPNPESSLTSTDNPYPHTANGALGKGGMPSPLPESIPFVMRDNPPCLHPAGGAHMSLADYSLWLRSHFDPAVQARLNISQPLLTKLHEIALGTGQNFYTFGGWGRLRSGDGYSLSHDGSNTMNYATAIIEVSQRRATFAVTNVGGEPLPDSTWLEGTHLVRDDLMSGELVF